MIRKARLTGYFAIKIIILAFKNTKKGTLQNAVDIYNRLTPFSKVSFKPSNLPFKRNFIHYESDTCDRIFQINIFYELYHFLWMKLYLENINNF